MLHRSLTARAAQAEAHYRRIQESGDQQRVLEAAKECASLYGALGNLVKESDSMYDVGKSQVLTGAYAAAHETAEKILAFERMHVDPVFKVQALLLKAAALRNQSHHDAAVETARQALAVMAEVEGCHHARAEAYQGIIACLVEAQKTDEAWAVHKWLFATLENVDDTKLVGHGFWTLGNLAFAKGQPNEGLEYHRRAAEQLQQINDIHVWARFNNASADVQLQAGITNQLTEDCITRAQLAYDVIGGSAVELLGLATTKARWYVATGQLEEASDFLATALFEARSGGAPDDASVHLLRSQILRSLSRHDEASRESCHAARLEGATDT